MNQADAGPYQAKELGEAVLLVFCSTGPGRSGDTLLTVVVNV